MVIGLVITFGFIFFIWLIFFKLKVLTFSPLWAVVSAFFGVHLLLLFVIAPRFFQPASIDARVIRHTIQLVPRLPEPTILTEVLVEPDVRVKKGTPLFRFDRTLYQNRLRRAEATLAFAKQHVHVLKAEIEAAKQAVAVQEAARKFAQDQVARYRNLAAQGAGSKETLETWIDKLATADAAILEAQANQNKAQLEYESNLDGVNTSVAHAETEVQEAAYYLDQTTIVAPEDGYITNLQARPGLVVGDVRIGAIASFVCEEEPYILATYYQEHLKYVKEGQPVEIALDTNPGEIFDGKVESIWLAVGQGQMMPTGTLPTFEDPLPKGRFAVRVGLDDPDMYLAAGVQGAVAIYTDHGTSFSILRRIEIRSYTYKNFLYPLPF